MLEMFSVQAVNIIEDAKNNALKQGEEVVGSEHLLVAMYNMKDSICHFLLSELNIKIDNILQEISKMKIIHKKENNTIFSKKFEQIIKNAKDLAILCKSDYVYDEHIFYSLLELKDSVAYEILENLRIDTEEMLDDIEEIFSFFEKDQEERPFPFLKQLKPDNFHHPYIKRKDYVEQIIYILKKKQKNNPLLIGNAGVGKSAIIEGVCKELKNELIYELDLGSIVAGTKYRGELEEKLLKAMDFIESKKAIVFIDEVHNIVGAGSNDGSLDISNILKPYLTNSNIKLIGATTIDEYHKHIYKDKALSRRFQNIYIDEATKEETLKILTKIKKVYENFHNIKYSYRILNKIVNKCDLYMPNRAFPDKAIDVLDEVGAISNYKNIDNLDYLIDFVICNIINIRPKSKSIIKKMKLNFRELIPFYIRFVEKKEKTSNLLSIGIKENFDINELLEDFYKVFSIKNESFLELDLENYTDITSLNNLTGSSKGYVGYESGGILYEHILKYPLSIVYFKNIKNAHPQVTSFISKLLKKENVIDNIGRKISFSNTIFILDKLTTKKENIGFEKTNTSKNSIIYDIELCTKDLMNKF